MESDPTKLNYTKKHFQKYIYKQQQVFSETVKTSTIKKQKLIFYQINVEYY